MLIVRGLPHAMQLAGLLGLVRLVLEMGMAEFVAQLTLHDYAIFYGGNQVILGTPKMLADGLSVIGNGCDFHSVKSP
jgi:hypothetical protein